MLPQGLKPCYNHIKKHCDHVIQQNLKYHERFRLKVLIYV